MQQADQTVLSLRPGGGRGRLLGHRFESSSSSSSTAFAFGSFSSDLPHLHPHGGAPSAFSIKVYGSRVFVSLFGKLLCDFFFCFLFYAFAMMLIFFIVFSVLILLCWLVFISFLIGYSKGCDLGFSIWL